MSLSDRRVSQTCARLYNACPHAAHLYDTHGGGRSAQMDRGSAMHWVIERCIRHCVEHDERRVPWEVAKAHVAAVERLMHVPFEERDLLSMMVFRWAEEFAVPEGWRVAAVEQLFEIAVGDWIVRARVDLALLSADGKWLRIEDWKSSRAMPSQKDVSERRADGTLSARSFQLILYALALRYGIPVNVIDCPDCGGHGELRRVEGDWTTCSTCTGDGEVEERGSAPLAPNVRAAEVAFVFPAIEDKTTNAMGRRTASLTGLDFEEYRDALDALVDRMRDSASSPISTAALAFPARPGSVCTECPAPLLCPIPGALRTYRDADGVLTAAGEIVTVEQASARAAFVFRAKAMLGALEQELKAWSRAHDGAWIPFGDQEVGWGTTARETIDKDGLFAALANGESVERERFVKSSASSRWTQRRRKGEADEAA